jgi:hypothetical protein
MKNKQVILSTTWAGLLIAWALYFIPKEPKYEPVKLVRDTTTARTQEMISPFWDTRTPWIQAMLPGIIWDTAESLNIFLDKNPILKQRIQGMIWYREYLFWKLSQEIAQQYISDALSIEQQLMANPWLLQKIQYEWWWQRYMRGDTNPTDMLAGNMASIASLQKIEQEQGELYRRAQESPLWNKWIQHWDDYIVVGQHELLTSLLLRLDQLDGNPGLEQQLTKLWYTRDNLVTDDWSRWQWIYGVIDTLREIDTLSTEAKERFFTSEFWKSYLAWNIRIQDIENYLHGQE